MKDEMQLLKESIQRQNSKTFDIKYCRFCITNNTDIKREHEDESREILLNFSK